MPIPQLSVKTQSPQNWRKKRLKKKKGAYKSEMGWKKRPIRDKNKNSLKRLISLGLTVLAFLFLFGGIVLIGAFAWISKDLPDPNKIIDRSIAQSTKIYDRTGENVLYEIHGEEKRTLINLEDIPQYAIDATIAVEDKTFYEHHGFNLLAMFKGAIIEPLISGKRARGGSTLTQQLVKNAILTSERKISRKIKEFTLSYQIEKKFSKDEILKMYFNEIPYGSVTYGIESASQTYFSKSARDLTLAEAALLSALPKAPTYYSPFGSNTDELYARHHYILDTMVEEGYIASEEAEQAKQEELTLSMKRGDITAPHFVMYVKGILTEKYGEKVVEREGLKVITTLDLDKQKIAEEVITEKAENNTERYNANNAALIALDPKNGQILTMVGSKDYFDVENDGNVNVTTRNRQPGSSMKPIIYAAALKKGYTPNTVLFDLVTTFKTATGDYTPHNYDLEERGPVTLRKALAGSLNIPAVKTIYLTGIDNVLDLSDKMGYTTLKDRSRFGLSLVLGGGEVKLLEHAAAFGVFATEGAYHQPIAILKVEDKDGNVLEEYEEEKGKKVLDQQITRQINNILSDDEARAFVFGAGSYLTLPGRPVAAKTGTTNDYRDAWTVGYTPSLVAGVWVGNNDNSEMRKGAAGGAVAAPIWHDFMKRALEGTGVEYFNAPEPVETGNPILDGETKGEVTIRIDKASGKLATELTPESFVEEKTYRQMHNILHYINKDDPRGAPPEDPTADPQYETWEAAIQKWMEEQDYENEETPEITEYDDLHTEENKPIINISYPESNQTIKSRDLEIRVQTIAPRGVRRVEYYIDDKLISTATKAPFTLSQKIKVEIENGFHDLTAIAYDDIDNSNQATISLNFLLPPLPPSASWLSPGHASSFYSSSFPLTLTLTTYKTDEIQAVNIYYTDTANSEIKLIKAIENPEQEFTVQWQNSPGQGNYNLYAEVLSTDNKSYQGESINITVK